VKLTSQLWNILVKSADEIAVLGLALLVFLNLGKLAINRYFDYLRSITPFQERLVVAVENVAGVAERLEQKVVREQALISTSIRALWDEWEANKEAERRAAKLCEPGVTEMVR
jgi:hypothetical protein